MTKVTIRRLATGVPGLDEILGGGLPEFSFNVIAGLAGCGKTTLAHQMMFAMASPDQQALYLTAFGEPPLKMLRYQQQFDFFKRTRVQSSIRYVNLSEESAEEEFDRLLRRITAEVQAQAPAIVFVDSFRSMVGEDGPTGQKKFQKFLQQLGMLMTSWNATTFLIGEYPDEAARNPVFTVADGVIWLRQSVQRNSMVRKLEIMKMRGQATLPGLHTFRIGSGGVKIFPPAKQAGDPGAHAPGGSDASRVSTGLPILDEMLGGGLPRGYSVLVAGPTGSGKSILASSFLAEGARVGETGVIAVFEQHPDRKRNRALTDLIESGQVGVVDSRSPDLSIDEIVLEIMNAIRRLKASRVVIDSLSGFELGVAPTFQEDFRESLSRMITALSRTGVTVLMTSELEDRYTDLRFSPYGSAFLTDAIIVQRYIELDSRLERVMAVVKVRASSHSNDLRLYSIDAQSIRIGEALPRYKGILGGRPVLKDAAAP